MKKTRAQWRAMAYDRMTLAGKALSDARVRLATDTDVMFAKRYAIESGKWLKKAVACLVSSRKAKE